MSARCLRFPVLAALFLAPLFLPSAVAAQAAPDWARVEEETMRHFQALLRLDTSNPPGNETRAADYLTQVLEAEGIPVERFVVDPARANIVARLRGNGSKQPLLIVGHTDVVTVDPAKWTFPPFSATRDGGWVYGRGTLDDKDNLSASLMMMLLLKRLNVPLDRDVIFLAEAGEEGTTRFGIDHMIEDAQFSKIEAEYCLAEGGDVTRRDGMPRVANVGVLEKVPRTIELVARGTAGHASVPLRDNALAHLARAVTAVAEWNPPVNLNEVTREYFRRLATISTPELAQRMRDVTSDDPGRVNAAVDWFEENAPLYAALVRTSASPTMLTGGARSNVIPSEVVATIDVRILPDEDPDELVQRVRDVVNNPAIEVRIPPRAGMPRPPGGTSISTEAFKAIEAAVTKHYNVITLPFLATGASDGAQLRSKGIDCYGIGPALDIEDTPKGFAAHSDQERILEAELHRFVRFYWDVVNEIAAR